MCAGGGGSKKTCLLSTVKNGPKNGQNWSLQIRNCLFVIGGGGGVNPPLPPPPPHTMSIAVLLCPRPDEVTWFQRPEHRTCDPEARDGPSRGGGAGGNAVASGGVMEPDGPRRGGPLVPWAAPLPVPSVPTTAPVARAKRYLGVDARDGVVAQVDALHSAAQRRQVHAP